MKNVLIIGSTGQIGSELTMKLRKTYRHGRIVAGYIPGSEPTGELLESGPAERANVCEPAVSVFPLMVSVNDDTATEALAPSVVSKVR